MTAGGGSSLGSAVAAVCCCRARHEIETSDLLGVNELRSGRCWSLVQVVSLRRSHEVGAGRRGCCTYLLYQVRVDPS